VAGIPTPQSFPQFLGQSIDSVTSRTGIRRLRVGGPFLSILEAAAQADVRSTQAVFQALNANDLDNTEGAGLDKIGESEDTPRPQQAKATGTVTIGDSSFTKSSTKIYQGTGAPIVGSVSINVEKSATFDTAASTGQIYIGRNTPNIEGPLTYTAKTDAGAYWTLSIPATPTTRFHNKGEEVVVAQGGNRLINAGELVQTPQGALSSAVTFSTLYDYTIPDGEVSVEGVEVSATLPGAAGSIPAGAITEFAGSVPFPGATVTNPAPFVSGRDTMKDNDYRDLIRKARRTKLGATDLALETKVVGAISSDENKEISSAKLVRRATGPDYLFIDDGSGYEEIYQGVGLEVIIEAAVGGESDMASIGKPVTKALVTSTNEAPFALQDSAGLRIDVGGTITTHNFDVSEFNSIASASAYEVVASINGDPDILFGARTADSGRKVVLFARSETNEDIQVLDNPTGIDAAPAFQFPTSRRYTSLLYRNDRLLSKDGRDAVYRSNRFSQWSSFTGNQTLVLAIDLTPAATYTFTAQDFVDASTGYTTVGRNSLAAWALVINRKIPGVTASVELDRLVLTSNLSRSSDALLSISGGTLVSNQMFAVGSGAGLEADYTLDRATGQFHLVDQAAAGDRFTLGSEWTRAFIETVALPATTLVDDLTTYWAVDADTSIVQHGVGVATDLTASVGRVTESGFQVQVHADSAVDVFASVLPGDWAVFYDPSTNLPDSMRRAFRVIEVLESGGLMNDLVIEKGAMLAARGGFRAVALPQVLAAPNRVLAIGGYTLDQGIDPIHIAARTGTGVTETCELFDFDTKEWTQVASMATARRAHTATTLGNGKVLVTGGKNRAGTTLSSTEIYDPATDTWTAGPAMAVARAWHSATLLASGRVLIAGGHTGTAATNTTQEYDPGTNTFVNASTMVAARFGHAALLVPAGSAAESNNVIVAGGVAAGVKLGSVERYDTGAFSWASKSSMANLRANMGFAVVNSAELVVVGDGDDASFTGAQGTYTVYDLAANTWSAPLAMGNDFNFSGKDLVKDAVTGDIFALYGCSTLTGSALMHMRFDGSSWNAASISSFGGAGVEKTGVQFVNIDGLTDPDTVFCVGGVSKGNLDLGLPSAGTTTASHEQLTMGLEIWYYPDSTEALAALPLEARGLQIVRTTNALQKVVVPAAANYTAVTFADALNDVLEGAEALVYRTNRLRVSTNSFDVTGDLSLVASDGSGPVPLLPNLLPLPAGDIETNLTGHFASVEAGGSGLGIPQNFQVHLIQQHGEPLVSDAARTVTLSSHGEITPSSGGSLLGLRRWDSGLNPNYWTFAGTDYRIPERGNLDHLRAAIASFDTLLGASGNDSYRIGLRTDPQNTLNPLNPVVLASPYAIGPRDDLNVVIDQDTETKRFAISMARGLAPATSTYGSTIALQDEDGGNVTISTTFGQTYDFDDFALFMKARGKLHDADATRRVLWRFFRHGPEGENVKVRYMYPDTAEAEPGIEIVLDDETVTTGMTAEDALASIHVKLNSGTARTGATLRVDSQIGYARANEAGVDADVYDNYLMTGFSIVEGERLLAGGTTRLRIQVPNNGTVAQGPQDSGLNAGQVLWFEAAAPSATTLFSGAFQIQSVGAFNVVTGQQDVFVPANTLHDGTSAWALAANPGTVSADGTGEVVFDPATQVGDLVRVNDTNTPGSYGANTMRVAGFGRQYLRLRAVDLYQDGPQLTPTWADVTDPETFLHFTAPTMTATQIVAAINAIVNTPVTGTVIGTGAGVLTLASWDEDNSATAGVQLADGVNFVQRTILPALPTDQHEFLLRDPVASALTANNDWLNEEVLIAPVLTADVVKWLNTPCISGLFTAAEVVASSDGTKVQIASLTAGAAGAVEVQGGIASAATAAVAGTAVQVSRSEGPDTCYVTLGIAETAGFTGGSWVHIDNSDTLPKVFGIGPTNTASITADGQWILDVAPYNLIATRNNARVLVERVGDFVAYHYPYTANLETFNANDIEEQMYLHVRGRATADSSLPDVASANQGFFRIVRRSVNELGVTFWVENSGAVEEAAECTLIVLSADSMVPGDKWVVSTTALGSRNRATWTIEEVGSITAGGNQYANNSFRVALADGTPDVLPTTMIGAAYTLLQLREGAPNRLWKQIHTITPVVDDSDFVTVQFNTDQGYGYITAAAGSVVSAAGKLAFEGGVALGVNGYNHSVGLIGEANKIVYGDAADTATYPGYAAAGATVLISGPRVKRARVALALRVKSGLASEDLSDRVRSAVAAVINQSKIGQPVAISDIVAAAASVPGVVAVSVLSPNYTSTSDQIPVAADEKLLALDLRADIAISFVGQ
jgi:hypothetical protein